jgi:hypothetical protein
MRKNNVSESYSVKKSNNTIPVDTAIASTDQKIA